MHDLASQFGFVSVIIPCYNKEQYIRDTLDSICGQSYQKYEIIVVDDCSTDDTRLILEEYSRSFKCIRFFLNERNRGANYCRNIGVEKAKGEYIIFLDADDILTPFCLERRMDTMEAFPDLDFSVFSMGVFHHKMGDMTGKWIPNSKRPLEDFLSHRLPWGICQPIWKKSFFNQIGGFDESFLRRQDVDLHTRALMYPFVQFRQVPGDVDCYYRIDEDRLNYKIEEFVRRSVYSSLQYCHKFFLKAKEMRLDGRIIGTVYKTYVWLINNYKNRTIGEKDFWIYESELFLALDGFNVSPLKRFLFRTGKFFNLHCVRIPGINWIIFLLVKR